MNQKASRRSRRQTTEEDTPPFKAPTPKPNGMDESASIPEAKEPKESTPPPEETSEPPAEPEVGPEKEQMVTRSRSTTPQVKKIANGHEDEDLDTSTKEEAEPIDEPDPELVFEENSDRESGSDSPVLSRCTTRRSLTRNIPTPKTPKSEEETPKDEEENKKDEEENKEDECEGEEAQEELNLTFESCSDNISTKVEVGGDSTRLNYTETNLEVNSFLQEAKNKSFGETLRRLSTRRTIRPISEDYRKRLLQTNFDRTDARTYPVRHSVERIAAVGLKRRNEDTDEEFTKRFKSESPGFFARFTSPLASIRNTFRGDVASSTPKLTGYKDEKFLLEEDGVTQMCEVKDGERRWCSIM